MMFVWKKKPRVQVIEPHPKPPTQRYRDFSVPVSHEVEREGNFTDPLLCHYSEKKILPTQKHSSRTSELGKKQSNTEWYYARRPRFLVAEVRLLDFKRQRCSFNLSVYVFGNFWFSDNFLSWKIEVPLKQQNIYSTCTLGPTFSQERNLTLNAWQ